MALFSPSRRLYKPEDVISEALREIVHFFIGTLFVLMFKFMAFL